MTIDEAIKHCVEVMMENLEKTKDRNASDPIAINCFECADEHRQLAEWLKELKAHREAWEKVKSEVDQHTEIHSDGEFYIKNFDVKKIIAEYRPKEGDAE